MNSLAPKRAHHMRRITRTILPALAVAVSATACENTSAAPAPATTSPTPASTAQAPANAPAISFPSGDLVWRDLPDSGGVEFADVRGDLAGHGPYEAFVKFPAGKDNPMHYHTSDLPTVVLSGTFYAVFDGKRIEYPAGSFYTLSAGIPHLSGCEPGTECLLFQYQTDNFDLVPTAAR
ncbi:cupin domain-containing protein [Nocardia sp. GCM10030253]|uniref:cupin domain-containing protein n=1 Tax=Nocardia sp. GCM10030253 TaxID=3273404 RepID=UPI00362727BD